MGLSDPIFQGGAVRPNFSREGGHTEFFKVVPNLLRWGGHTQFSRWGVYTQFLQVGRSDLIFQGGVVGPNFSRCGGQTQFFKVGRGHTQFFKVGAFIPNFSRWGVKMWWLCQDTSLKPRSSATMRRMLGRAAIVAVSQAAATRSRPGSILLYLLRMCVW